MQIKEVDLSTIGPGKYHKTKLQAIFEEFENSSYTEVELVPQPGEYSRPEVMASTICKSLQRFGYKFKCKRMKDRVFLVKETSVLWK